MTQHTHFSGTVYQPTLPEAMPFFALSAYQYTLFELQVPDSEDGSFSAGDLRQAAIDALEMVRVWILTGFNKKNPNIIFQKVMI